MNATDVHNKSTKDRAIQVKKSRKDKNRSNVNRVNQRFNSDNSNKNLKKTNEDGHKVKALNDFNDIIESLETTLESLPSKVLHHPAKDLASLALSAAIATKHSNETLTRLQSPSSVPNSTRINFTIQGTKKMTKNIEFQEIKKATEIKVKAFELYLKSQVILAQQVEVSECIFHFHKTLLHNILQLCNCCVRFYKTLYKSDDMINEKILSQMAVRNVFMKYEDFKTLE